MTSRGPAHEKEARLNRFRLTILTSSTQAGFPEGFFVRQLTRHHSTTRLLTHET